MCVHVSWEVKGMGIYKNKTGREFLIGNTAECVCKALLHYLVCFWYFAN